MFVIYFLLFIIYYKVLIDKEFISSYECGFDPTSFTRLTFSYRFFLISILFVIFDVEIALILSIPFLIGSIIGVWIFLFFILILIGGLLYEYNYGSLDWLNNILSKA